MSEFIDEFIETWKKVITTPSGFFRDMPTSGGYDAPLKFAAANYIIAVFIFVIAAIGQILITTDSSLFMADRALLSVMVMPVVCIVGLFISGLIFYICFKIVGGSGSYEGTVRIVSYASAVAPVAWIPLIWIYPIYLTIVGGTFVHNITTVRSAIAVFIPIIMAVILAFIASS